jgi:hypothetical protein
MIFNKTKPVYICPICTINFENREVFEIHNMLSDCIKRTEVVI